MLKGANIKGVTDTDIGLPPKIGRLNKGGEKQNGQFGENLKGRFRFTPVVKTDTALTDAFMAAYGGEMTVRSVRGRKETFQEWPRSLDIQLMHENPADAFVHGFYEWSAGGLLHICDGETMKYWYDPQIRKLSMVPKPCPYFSGQKSRTTKEPGCKLQGTLSLYLPLLYRRGYVTWTTSSQADVKTIPGILWDIYHFIYKEVRPAAEILGETFDFRLTTTPLILTRHEKDISRPGENGPFRSPDWQAHLEIRPDWFERLQRMVTYAKPLLLSQNKPYLLTQEAHPQLNSPIEYEDAEVAEVTEDVQV